jgi:hypothetical protein
VREDNGSDSRASQVRSLSLHKQNDSGGNDEPYVLTLSAKVDARLADLVTPVDQKTVPIHSPTSAWVRAT